MAIAMARPYKHPTTGIWWFRARVPLDVVDKAKGRKVSVPVGKNRREILLGEAAKVSLATRDPAEAKARHAAVLEALSAIYAGIRSGPIVLSFRQRQVISGEIYNRMVAEAEDEPGDVTSWEERRALLKQHHENDWMLDILLGTQVDEELGVRGLEVTEDSRRDLLRDVAVAWTAYLRDAEAMARRDYTARSFPVDRDTPSRPAKPKGKAVTFESIIDERVKRLAAGKGARGANAGTISKFRREAALFVAHRGSDDATTTTRAEAEAWTVSIQTAGKVGNRTLAHYLVDMQTVWNWGSKMFPGSFTGDNPFKAVEKPSFDTIAPGERAFRMDEAKAILTAARLENEPGKRWLPFMAAYSGARISELSFLRPEDFRQIGDAWFFTIADNEFRSLKTRSSRRTVPIHPALVSEGLMTFVKGANKGVPLFKARDHENVGRWIKNKVKLERAVAPNHGWRHLMTDLLTNIGASNRVRLSIVGRASGSSEDQYGGSDVALPGLWQDLAKIEPIIPPPPAPEEQPAAA